MVIRLVPEYTVVIRLIHEYVAVVKRVLSTLWLLDLYMSKYAVGTGSHSAQ